MYVFSILDGRYSSLCDGDHGFKDTISAATRKLDLLDESINLSSSFQLVVFPTAVDTLWPVTDVHSAKVIAQGLYQWMLDGEKMM